LSQGDQGRGAKIAAGEGEGVEMGKSTRKQFAQQLEMQAAGHVFEANGGIRSGYMPHLRNRRQTSHKISNLLF
jgi:hypothetical protein